MTENNLTINQELRRLADVFQSTFSEIIRLVLKKSIRGNCNGVNGYNYYLTNDVLGWRGEYITAVKFVSKSVRGRVPMDYSLLKLPPTLLGRVGRSAQTPYSPNSVFKADCNDFQKFTNCVSGQPLTSTIANGQTCTAYTSFIGYSDIFKQLQSIGRDIIRETEPCLSELETSSLPTAMLRVHLFNLNQYLCQFESNIYDGIIDLIHLINSVNCNQIIDVVSLISITCKKRWEDLPPCTREKLCCKLGEEFINEYLANEVITILTQSNQGELVLEIAYGYSVFKMLYIIFGYGLITPILLGCNKSECDVKKDARFVEFRNRFRGARQQHSGAVNYVDKRLDSVDKRLDSFDFQSQQLVDICDDVSTKSCRCEDKCHCSEKSVRSDCEDAGSSKRTRSCSKGSLEEEPIVELAPLSCEPLDKCVIAHIAIFIEMYRNINNILVKDIPECHPYLDCNDVPCSYKGIPSIAGYLRRYFNFSFCFYQSYIDTKTCHTDVGRSVNALINTLRYM